MSRLWEKAQVHLALVLLQSLFAGYQIISRVAINDGLSVLIFSLYRNFIALALLVPAAILFERKTRPPLTWRLLGKFFILGFLGIFGTPVFFLVAVGLSSAAFGAAFQNITPVATFIVAAAWGVEEVNFKRKDGKAKVSGTVLCMLGAMTMSLYKGPALLNNPYSGLGAHEDSSVWMLLTRNGAPYGQWESLKAGIGFSDWQLASLLLLLVALTWAFYLTLQAPIQIEYPAPTTIMAFTYFFGTLQFAVAALWFERDISQWKLEWGPGIAGIAYSAVIASCVCYTLQAWCVQHGGPLLTSVYMPLQSLLGLVLAVIILGDALYLGSIIGAVVTVMGLYLVTWGRAEALRLKALAKIAEVVDVEKANRLRKQSDDLSAPLLHKEADSMGPGPDFKQP